MSSCIRAVALAASLAGLSAHAQTPTSPEDDVECRNGRAMVLASQHELAAQHLLACAKVPGQTPFVIARSRLDRFSALEKLGDRAAAEAELVALTSRPISEFSVFTRDGALSGALLSAAAKTSVGVTQPRLLAVLATYRLAAEDATAAIAIAERAMRAAERNPAAAVEVSTAFVARGKARFINKNETGAISDIVAAYLRGSEDAWVIGQVDGFPADARAHLADLRKLMLEQSANYSQATSTMGALTMDKEKLKEVLAKAGNTLPYIEAEETRLAGPRTWDTRP